MKTASSSSLSSRESASGSSTPQNTFGSPSSPSIRVHPPTWQPDATASSCSGCSKRFSLFVRRHHCRCCGKVFCDLCTSRRWNIPSASHFSLSRVCSPCFSSLSRGVTRLPTHPGHPPTIRQESAPELMTPQVALTSLAATISTAASSAFTQLSTSINSLDEHLSRHFDTDFFDPPPSHRRASSASMYTPSLGERRNVYQETVDEENMNECPVCGIRLARLGTEEAREKHVGECLAKPGGGSVRGTRYLIQVLDETLEKECVICFNDLEKGQKIARLNCLCIYHADCIDDWFLRSQECPVHFTF
ncbi:hypothetical protein BC829DRAFT_408812 [Chytridium lagenaria]|nr:hypothetical protein BC829DRAFT_408812 [Chytridium lagenaria]